MLSRMKTWARRLYRDGHAIYLASRDPRVPWYAKFLAIAVAGYALSPIDLIPDFIPVVGYLGPSASGLWCGLFPKRSWSSIAPWQTRPDNVRSAEPEWSPS